MGRRSGAFKLYPFFNETKLKQLSILHYIKNRFNNVLTHISCFSLPLFRPRPLTIYFPLPFITTTDINPTHRPHQHSDSLRPQHHLTLPIALLPALTMTPHTASFHAPQLHDSCFMFHLRPERAPARPHIVDRSTRGNMASMQVCWWRGEVGNCAKDGKVVWMGRSCDVGGGC
jgi:hypothetical protein